MPDLTKNVHLFGRFSLALNPFSLTNLFHNLSTLLSYCTGVLPQTDLLHSFVLNFTNSNQIFLWNQNAFIFSANYIGKKPVVLHRIILNSNLAFSFSPIFFCRFNFSFICVFFHQASFFGDNGNGENSYFCRTRNVIADLKSNFRFNYWTLQIYWFL